MKTVFSNKVDIAKGEEFTIGKVVELSQTEYEHFSTNLLDEYPFIEEYADKMERDEKGVRNCLLVLCEGEDDGILVNSQGEANARYSARLPKARQIAVCQKYPLLKQFMETMADTVEHYTHQAIDLQKEGEYRLEAAKVMDYAGQNLFHEGLFFALMAEREEIESMDEDTEGYDIKVKAEEQTLRRLTQEEVDRMCREHIQWFRGGIGRQADFSGCLLENVAVTEDLPNAILDNAKLVNVSFENKSICFSSFKNAKFFNCNFKKVDSTFANYRHAKFYGCDISGGLFEDADLSSATFVGGKAHEVDFVGSCIDKATFEDWDYDTVNFLGVYDDRARWEQARRGMKMEEPQ